MADYFFWMCFLLVSLGYIFTVFRAFDEEVIWGWWVLAFPPLNLWYAYVCRCVDRKPLFFYVAGLSLWAFSLLIGWAAPTVNAAPWHGFELAA